MAAVDGPRAMVPGEYDEVLGVMEQAFGFTRQQWLRQFPSVRRERFLCDDHFVISEDGHVAAQVAIYPVPAVVDGTNIVFGGIGSVATHPSCQGKGYFGRLMEHVNGVMRQRGYPLAILWGRTQRYRHFGYEPAGSKIVYQLRPQPASPNRRLDVRGMDPERDLDWLMAAHAREPLRVERTPDKYLELLSGAGVQVWVGEGPEGRAYVALADGAIAESGGDAQCCADLLSHLVRSYGHVQPEVSLAARDSALSRLLYEASSSWQVEPIGMVKVLDLVATLRCFRHQMENKLRRYGPGAVSPVTLALADSDEQATLGWDGTLSVEPGGGGEVISLPERVMTRLLFGPTLERYGDSSGTRAMLANVFPLEFYVGAADQV